MDALSPAQAARRQEPPSNTQRGYFFAMYPRCDRANGSISYPAADAYCAGMLELERLHHEHATALLAFEQENRAYFAASVSDRGDEFFTHFDARLADLLTVQAAGQCHFHVVVGSGGEILGRVNLVDATDGCAELGYRIAERAAGRRLATSAVREVIVRAATAYGLTALRARTTLDNGGSQAVLARNGFTATGEIIVGDRPGLSYVRDLRVDHDETTR